MDEDKPTESNNNLEKLQHEVDELRNFIKDSYYRVPKEEFETITRQRIAKDVSESLGKKITTWRNWGAVIIAGLSFFGFTQITNTLDEIKENIDTKIALSMSNATKDMSSSLKDMSRSLEEDMKSFEKDQFSRLDIQNNLVKSEISSIDNKINNTSDEVNKNLNKLNIGLTDIFKSSFRTELLNLRTEFDKDSTKKDYKQNIIIIKNMIEKANDKGEISLVPKCLEELIYQAVISTDYEGATKVQIDYLRKKGYELTVTGWKNLLLSNVLLYEEKFSPVYKEMALESYIETLELEPDHPHAHTLRLIIHMIDYKRGVTTEDKEKEKQEALKSITGFVLSSGNYLAYTITDYLEIMYILPSLKQYTEELVILFPDLMNEMYKKADEYLLGR